MSQQEFVDPEQDYDETQQKELDRSHQQELTGEDAAQYHYDEASRRHLVGEKLQPRRRRRSALGTLIVFLVLILFALCSVLGFTVSHLFSSLGSFHSVTWGQYPRHGHTIVNQASVQAFPVGDSVNLVVNDPVAGSIRVHTGNTSQVVVSTTMQTGQTGLPSIQYSSANSVVTLNVSGVSEDESAGVILDIFTPSNISVNIQADSAAVNVEDVEGQITANTGSGPIDVTDNNGPLNLTTSSGHISALNDNLRAPSVLKTEDGDINFAGSLDPKGHYQFASETGSINISLPQYTSFQLNTTEANASNVKNEFGNSANGNSSHATIDASTGEGSINVQKI